MPLARLGSHDRNRAIDALRKGCRIGDLEEVLSKEDVYLGFQSELISLYGEDKLKRLSELVTLLLGDGLLKSSIIRSRLCKQAAITSPSGWQAGTPPAIQLCKKLGLPEVFAGTQVGPLPPPVFRLGSSPQLPPLQDYQQEVLRASIEHLRSGRSVLLSLPTGAGKTRAATEIMREWHGALEGPGTTFWLAHTEELCEQAAQSIIQVWRGSASPPAATLFRAWGKNTKRIVKGEVYNDADLNQMGSFLHAIVVSTPLTATQLLKKPITGSFGKALSNQSLLIIDEAHRAAAPTYRDAIRELRHTSGQGVGLIGLSATPVRHTYASRQYEGTEELAKLFEKLVEPVNTLGSDKTPVEGLQRRGILARLEISKIGSPKMSSREMASAIARQRKRFKGDGAALLFTATVSEAKVMATYLVEKELDADYVAAQSDPGDRAALVDGLRAGKIDILCNCEILTTGFDAPRVSELYLARETASPVLYKQIVGRGLRGPAIGGSAVCRLYLCGIDVPFGADPNTSEFARAVWARS